VKGHAQETVWKNSDPSDDIQPSKGLSLAQQRQFDLVSFRVSWSQAILFGCYEVTASFLLVIVSMIYYKKPEDEQVTECGTLLPNWKSVAVIFSFYTLVWFAMVVANFWFIRHTRRQAASDVSAWVMLTHPAGRLILGLFSFFITCAFSSPPKDPSKATTLQYVNRISMWVVKSALVIDAVFLLFFIYSVIRKEIEWLRAGTHVWTARQLIILQLKFTMIVCYLSTHINVVILTASIFACNAFIFVIWSRLMSSSRKAKQKYSNPNYDENENDH